MTEDLVGKPFKDRTMRNEMDQEVRLSDEWAKGTVLLLVFSSAFGFVCNLEMLTFTAMKKAFEEANCQIFGVSNDNQRSLGAYSENLKIGFHLLSDEGAKMARSLNAMEADDGPWPGFPKRSEFMIDRKGMLRYAHIPPDSNWEPDYDAMLEMARKLAQEYEEESRRK
ncbi:MAG: redoxin domain-containing protein [Methanomassiliicoccales archaeon]